MEVGRKLKENFMEKHGISQYRLAGDIDVYASHLQRIIEGERRITVSIGLKLAKYFDTEDDYWIIEQIKDDIKKCRVEMKDELERIKNISKERKKGK